MDGGTSPDIAVSSTSSGKGGPWDERSRAQCGASTQPVPAGGRDAAALVLGAAFMLLADTSIVNIAVPSIQRDIGASVPDVQLMIAGYQVAYAVMLITGGRLGDLWGRRRMFIIGAASFTLASLGSGLDRTRTISSPAGCGRACRRLSCIRRSSRHCRSRYPQNDALVHLPCWGRW